jgi:ABC-type amino acid transport substrate-binding protein
MKPGSYVYVAEKDVDRFVERGFKPISIMQDGKQLYYRPFGWAVEQRFYWERGEMDEGCEVLQVFRIFDRKLGSGDNYGVRPSAIAYDVDLANAVCEALNERVDR